MARKKDSKALFEVLSRADTTMSVPDWMKAKPVGDATPPSPETDESPKDDALPPEAEKTPSSEPADEIDTAVEIEPDAGETIEYEEPAPPAEGVESEGAETPAEETPLETDEAPEPVTEAPSEKPAVRWKDRFGGRQPGKKAAAFSLKPRKIVIVIGVIGVLILLAFVLGRYTIGRMGSDPAAPSPTAATDGAERRAIVDTDAPRTCVSGRRDPDRFFLVIQTLRGNGDAEKVEAQRIIAFCRARGLPADMVEIVKKNQPRVAVWSLLGYRFANSKPAMEHARKVEELGRAYHQQYNTYTFRQPRTEDGTLRPFFVSGKAEQTVE